MTSEQYIDIAQQGASIIARQIVGEGRGSGTIIMECPDGGRVLVHVASSPAAVADSRRVLSMVHDFEMIQKVGRAVNRLRKGPDRNEGMAS